ncbi:hypothetical protein Syun_027741 [Stephania yunnanensis]|uniref:Nudix hydrolase domain-containing protein n=1 Tax=Stephania yunnanensis TaxID=152371 RepID=A0AAP0EG43_9MAGN
MVGNFSTALHDKRGEVSLPGGKVEEGDANDIETAMREAKEEIGLDPSLLVQSNPSVKYAVGPKGLKVFATVGPREPISSRKPMEPQLPKIMAQPRTTHLLEGLPQPDMHPQLIETYKVSNPSIIGAPTIMDTGVETTESSTLVVAETPAAPERYLDVDRHAVVMIVEQGALERLGGGHSMPLP